MKKTNLYEIRYWPSATALSRSYGRRLVSYRRACRIVRRLKGRGLDAFHEKLTICH